MPLELAGEIMAESPVTSTAPKITFPSAQVATPNKTTVVEVNTQPSNIFSPYQPLVDALQTGAWAILLFLLAVSYLAKGKVLSYFEAVAANLRELVAETKLNKDANNRSTEAIAHLEVAVKELKQSHDLNGKILTAVYRIGRKFRDDAEYLKSHPEDKN